MNFTTANTKLCSPRQVAYLGRVIVPRCQIQPSIVGYPTGLRVAALIQPFQRSKHCRDLSTTSVARLRDFFPAKETAYIRKTPPAWPHHGWTEEEMLSVVPEHRKPKTVGDWLAWKLVRLCRYALRLSTSYQMARILSKC